MTKLEALNEWLKEAREIVGYLDIGTDVLDEQLKALEDAIELLRSISIDKDGDGYISHEALVQCNFMKQMEERS